MLVKIIATSPSIPGDAQLVVMLRGVSELVEKLEFSLLNNEQNYLQSDKSWSPAPHWFAIQGGYSLSNGSGFYIGHEIVDPLLASHSQIQIQARMASGETLTTTLKINRDELLPSSARGESCEYGGSSELPVSTREISTPLDSESQTNIVATEPQLAPEPVIAPTEQEPRTKPQTPIKTKSKLPFIVAGIVLLLLILAAVFFWFSKLGSLTKDTEQSSEEVTTTKAPAEPGPATEENSQTCDINSIGSGTKDQMAFVQACFSQNLPADDLLKIIQAAKEAQKCEIAQRLYANRAQSGDAKIALAYAHEYDPKYHQPNSCFKDADKDTAAYWYDTALQSEPDNADAKQRYEELSK
jgi:hypothetical protein